MNIAVPEMTFAREPLAAILESGLASLLFAHWKEVAHDKDVIALDPDWPEYFAQEKAGRFVAFTLRRGSELCGYNAFFIAKSLHYKAHTFAVNDVIYLKPEERGVDGIKLIAFAERALKWLGVSKAFYHIKADAVLGSPAGDSLEAVEHMIELADEADLPPELFDAGADRTVGAVLKAMGYGHVENHFGKLLVERP